MTLKRSIGIALLLGSALYAQQVPPGPAFEVASIKAAPVPTAAMVAAGKFHTGIKVDQAQVNIGYSSLADLIRMAYEVKPYQISGPDWMVDQKWDILATIPDGVQQGRVPKMLQLLLAERFGLTVHRESQGRKVYGLEVAKSGPKLKASPRDQEPASEPSPSLTVATSRDGNSTVSSGAGFGITKTEMRPDGSMHFESSKMTPAQLADAVSFYLDRPVVDLTRLPGSYLVELEFSGADLRYAAIKAGAAAYPQPAADASRAADLAAESVGASLITSIQKLGLRLEPQQAPIEMIVVDHLGRAPTAN